MRDFVHFRNGTILMALLQPAPETYELFDDIMLLSEGEYLSECRDCDITEMGILLSVVKHGPNALLCMPNGANVSYWFQWCGAAMPCMQCNCEWFSAACAAVGNSRIGSEGVATVESP
jgi:hypothetical protein